jgi:hypothetical protein
VYLVHHQAQINKKYVLLFDYFTILYLLFFCNEDMTHNIHNNIQINSSPHVFYVIVVVTSLGDLSPQEELIPQKTNVGNHSGFVYLGTCIY